MSTPSPDPETPTGAPEETAVPILPAMDIPETLAFFGQLGFETETDDGGGYAFVRRGGIELHYAASPHLDPFSTAGMAFIRVRDVQAFYDEFRATGLWEPTTRGPELEAELRDRLASGDSIARIGRPEDKPWRLKEFPVFDSSNNWLRFGQPLGR